MSNDIYVDPNSGSAPQPGGWAGADAGDKGFALPPNTEAASEQSPAEYVAPGGSPSGTYPALSDEFHEASVEEPEEVVDEDDADADADADDADEADDADADGDDDEGGDDDDSDDSADDSTDDQPEEEDGDVYDPADYNVEQVNAFLAEHPELRDAVVAAEKAGKNRVSITGE